MLAPLQTWHVQGHRWALGRFQGSMVNWYELALKIFTMMMSFRFKRRMSEIMGRRQRRSDI